MPTPFTHLAAAQRLLDDDAVPADFRARLRAELGAFLLGNVAADAHPPGTRREDTHFYAYDKPLDQPPWRVMLARYPALERARDAAHEVFLAGYVAHLSMDEIWTLHMLGPHFAGRDWGESHSFRFLMLHALLIYMDERDHVVLQPWQHPALAAAQPHAWLPFLDDATLYAWRDFIGEQIRPGGDSQTLRVFGSRIAKTPDELRAILDSPQQMQAGLWDNIPPGTLAAVETLMYDYAREQMLHYLER